MPEEIIGLVALASGLLMSAAYNKYLKKHGTRKQRFVARAKENYCSVNGISVKSVQLPTLKKKSDSICTPYKTCVTYQYVANGEMYYKKQRFLNVGFGTFPDRTTIYYDKYNPKKCIAENEVSEPNIIKDKAVKTLSLLVFTITLVGFALKMLF